MNFWLKFLEMPGRLVLSLSGLEFALLKLFLLKEFLNLDLFLDIRTPLDLKMAKGSSSKKDFDFFFFCFLPGRLELRTLCGITGK